MVSQKKMSQLMFNAPLKVPGPIASDFLKLSDILVSEGSSYFSHYPSEFYSWNMYHLEDINEN